MIENEEDKDQFERWKSDPMTERLARALAERKMTWLVQIGSKSASGSVDEIRALGGRIQGLQEVEALLAGGLV